jgi:hypothetical protein
MSAPGPFVKGEICAVWCFVRTKEVSYVHVIVRRAIFLID